MPADADRIKVQCPSCGQAYSLRLKFAGKTAKCGCGARVAIPAAPPAEPEPVLLVDEFFDDGSAGEQPDDFEVEAPAERVVPGSVTLAIQTGQAKADEAPETFEKS